MICTRHGADKEALAANDLLLCKFSGEVVEGEGRPTSELNMHRTAYAMRPEILSVVHAHPPTATGFGSRRHPARPASLAGDAGAAGPGGAGALCDTWE